MNDAPGTRLVIRTLGGIEATVGGAPLLLPTRKALLLLVAIAMAPEMRTGRDRLRALLWSERGEEQGRGSLRHALAAVRKALPDPTIVETTSEAAALDRGRTTCDAAEFRHAASHHSSATAAADLYRGAFLDGVEPPDPAFETWMLAERRALHARAIALADGFDPAAAPPDARRSIADLAHRLIAEDPACEEAYRALIRCDLAEGRRNAAIRRFEECRAVVRAMLDAEPEEMTRALIEGPAAVSSARAQPAALAPAEPEPTHPSIVVLPFKNLSNDPEQGFFADGVVEEITSVLSRVRDFFVIARQTAETLRNSTLDSREIGRSLGVRYILEGAVRRSGDRARITVALIDAEIGTQIWSNRFDGNASDVFDFQDEVAAAVAGALHPSLRQAEIDRTLRKRPENLQAYDLILQAYPHFWAHAKDDNAAAIGLFRRALEFEPDNALAAAMLAWCLAQDAAYLWTEEPDAALAEAIELARRAARPDDGDPSTMVAAAAAFSLASAELPTARMLLERALEIDPNHAWGWMRIGWLYHYEGRTEGVVEVFERALKLSPYDPFAFNMLIGGGMAYQRRGDYQRALELVEAGLRIRPGIAWGYRTLASTAATAGDMEKARDAMLRFREKYPDVTLARMRRAMPFALVDTNQIYWEGLRLAGLPEE